MGRERGQKNFKGSAGIVNDRRRLRLRWRYQRKRYSLNLFHFTKVNLNQARKTALQIEQDMVNNEFEQTPNKYSGKAKIVQSVDKTIVEYFEEWTSSCRLQK